MKNAIDQKAQLHEQAIDNGQVFGPGAGMGFGKGNGQGKGMGQGKGFGQRDAGSGNCNFQAQAPATLIKRCSARDNATMLGAYEKSCLIKRQLPAQRFKQYKR